MTRIDSLQVSLTLTRLKMQLSSILDLFSPSSRIFYVDYPVHSNIGDLLINLGTEQFFRDYRIPIYKRYSIMDIPQTFDVDVNSDTTFLCHGGGNFGDLYPKHQMFREKLLDKFPKARIIFLPQSLHYTSKRIQQTSLSRIANHQNCHILVRDLESLHVLQSAHISHCSLMPDMAHQLWQLLEPSTSVVSGHIMYFLRQDIEAVNPPIEQIEKFTCQPVDWKNVVSKPCRAFGGIIYWLLKLGGQHTSARLNASMWYFARDKMIADAVASFSKCELVHTDRLHGMLLALLLGRNVEVSDNSYGKLSRYVSTWLT